MKVKTQQPKQRRDFESMRPHAYNQWEMLIDAAGGSHLTTGKHMACPFNDCGSEKDGFRYTNVEGNGEWICGGKGNQHWGDGFDLVAELQGTGGRGAYDLVRGILGEPYRERTTGGNGDARASQWRQPGETFQQSVKSALEGQETKEKLNNWQPIPFNEWMIKAALDPEIKPIIGPFSMGQTSIVSGAEKAGKTMFTAGLVRALVMKEPFAHWKWHPKPDGSPWRIYWLDCEMSRRRLYDRARAMAMPPCTDLFLDDTRTRGEQGQPLFELGNPQHHEWLINTMGELKIDFMVLDNVMSSLVSDTQGDHGLDVWRSHVRGLEEQFRNSARCLVMIDHSNQQGHVGGSIQKRRSVDMLLEITSADSSSGMAFNVEQGNNRDEWPKEGPAKFTMTYNQGAWGTREFKQGRPETDSSERDDEILRMAREGMNNTQIGEALGLTKQGVAYIRKSIQLGK